MAMATVTATNGAPTTQSPFGHWLPTPITSPIDRFAADPRSARAERPRADPEKHPGRVGDPVKLHHQRIPTNNSTVIYQAGDSQPDDIAQDESSSVSGWGTFPPLINDPLWQPTLYRGLDPRALPAFRPLVSSSDERKIRVEAVGIQHCGQGRYLVLCGVLRLLSSHRRNRREFIMFGYVDVRGND